MLFLLFLWELFVIYGKIFYIVILDFELVVICIFLGEKSGLLKGLRLVVCYGKGYILFIVLFDFWDVFFFKII